MTGRLQRLLAGNIPSLQLPLFRRTGGAPFSSQTLQSVLSSKVNWEPPDTQHSEPSAEGGHWIRHQPLASSRPTTVARSSLSKNPTRSKRTPGPALIFRSTNIRTSPCAGAGDGSTGRVAVGANPGAVTGVATVGRTAGSGGGGKASGRPANALHASVANRRMRIAHPVTTRSLILTLAESLIRIVRF